MEANEYVPIPGYPMYEINRQGHVRALKTGKRGPIQPASRYTLYTGGSISGRSFSRSALLILCFGPETGKRQLSQQTRNRMSKSRIGSNNPNSRYIYVVNGKRHETIKAATTHYNNLTNKALSERTVQRKCRNRLEFCYLLDKSKLVK